MPASIANKADADLTTAEKAQKKQILEDIANWGRNEQITRYVLSRVLTDAMLRKVYSTSLRVDEMWTNLVKEFKAKTAIAQSELRAKFLAYRCPEKGDVRRHLDVLSIMC
jgi:hypothetical protein